MGQRTMSDLISVGFGSTLAGTESVNSRQHQTWTRWEQAIYGHSPLRAVRSPIGLRYMLEMLTGHFVGRVWDSEPAIP